MNNKPQIPLLEKGYLPPYIEFKIGNDTVEITVHKVNFDIHNTIEPESFILSFLNDIAVENGLTQIFIEERFKERYKEKKESSNSYITFYKDDLEYIYYINKKK